MKTGDDSLLPSWLHATLGWLAVLAAGAVHLAGVTGCQPAEVREGAALYAAHCARCHGARAAGQDPRRPFGGVDPRLGLVAPALNGQGHCWQHPPDELFAIVKHGSPLPNSPMAAWGDRLSDREIRAVVAYLHSLWPRRIRRQVGRSAL